MPAPTTTPRLKKAAYSVAETAALCGVSRARFYDHITSGVMPPPLYALRTRRPFYPADLAVLCVRIRETNVGFDGAFVMFYDRKQKSPTTPVPTNESSRNVRKAAASDPLTQEMVETLRAMGVQTAEAEVLIAISRQCPAGVAEETFETDLRAIFDALRRPESA